MINIAKSGLTKISRPFKPYMLLL